jgi:hypothetical protein
MRFSLRQHFIITGAPPTTAAAMKHYNDDERLER